MHEVDNRGLSISHFVCSVCNCRIFFILFLIFYFFFWEGGTTVLRPSRPIRLEIYSPALIRKGGRGEGLGPGKYHFYSILFSAG